MTPNYLGWIVRVIVGGKFIATYAAGFQSHKLSEEAVKNLRNIAGEEYIAVDGILANHGPTIEPGEVREI
jgi:hypothetical protein